ncbi:A disintegrin and metalloproteinase with thrombospondin motifs 9 [Chelonia mydas]|uniref:A disintegrin and metalloproteinase with thrombospondin motifs 9 n=1 Tax=Chelonia mydas TaxID=8469 RepID=M7AZC3_CHEMY|nr:A disintegrin and metalloproteinase with thrombospondin motifs 9 [Chelonia mydas]
MSLLQLRASALLLQKPKAPAVTSHRAGAPSPVKRAPALELLKIVVCGLESQVSMSNNSASKKDLAMLDMPIGHNGEDILAWLSGINVLVLLGRTAEERKHMECGDKTILNMRRFGGKYFSVDVTRRPENGIHRNVLWHPRDMFEKRYLYCQTLSNNPMAHVERLGFGPLVISSGVETLHALGTFRSHDGDYFVEPLLSPDGQEYEEEHNKPHVVYRHTAPQKDSPRERHTCDTSGHENSHKKSKRKNRRRQWQESSLLSDVAALKHSIAGNQFSTYNNKTENTSDDKTHRRTKRFLSYPRFVEVMVVADSRMVAYHGVNLQHYILTLMSIVASIYKDPSIGNLINIVIVKLVVIHNEQDGPSISYNAQTTLKNFCQWQHSQNHPEENNLPKHDTAVLVTRQDICRAHDKCDTLGLAELGTVCDPYRSCSISEDNGLSTAFTIAHELGHVFNMPHDDNNKCKEDGGKNQQHVMAPTLNFYTNPWMWSKCSRKYITEFLEPKNGGKYCVGRRMKFKSCNTEPCSKLKKDFRDEQCADFDGKHFNINGLPPNVRWVPKYSGILMKDRCKLFCRVAGNTAYYQLRDRVVDGTPCGPDTNDICVQGLCRQAGCDHVLNSKARRDKCGICGGDNSSCKTVAGTFNTVHYGYNTVVHIPAGATNIDVRQHSYSGKPEDDNYLALSNSHGVFILNGDFVVSMFKREIKVGNAVIEYSGSDNTIERINSTERIEQEIVVQILSVGNLYNPDVRYTFNIPIEDKPQQYYWNIYGPWQACSKLCQGERKRKPICARESDQLMVSDQRCDRIPQPDPVTEPCSTECELRWHIARKSECTAQCGLGYRTLEVYCTKYSRSEGKTEKVDDRFCGGQTKPNTREKCFGDCNVGGWRYSAWSECSKSCGGGTRRRRAICVNTLNDVLDDSKCSRQEKLVVQRCSDFLCPQWRTGDWSECTVTCGQGYQMRAVKCVVGAYVSVVDDNECNAATRPTDTQDCEIAACPLHPAAPETKRSMPSVHRTQWRFGSWTPCSMTCGKGTRMRYVSCRDDQGSVADEAACFHLPKPSATEVCSVTPCGQWKALEWSSCSVTCGQGKATRQVVCLNYSDQVVDRSECDPDDLPATDQDCSVSSCQNIHDYGRPIHPFPYPEHQPKSHPGGNPNQNTGPAHIPGDNQWRIGPWGACSSTCAGGFQRRVVVCQDENGYTASNCDEKAKPVEQRSCESGPCPQWAYGSWGECTKACGAGTRTRLVVCQRPNGERFPDLSCEILDKPPDRERCNMQDCPRDAAWNSGPWSSCSASCGRGHKHRNVYCLSKEGNRLENDYCKHLAKPNVQRKCRGGRCPKWKTGDWGQCMKTCGEGSRYRKVVCVNQNNQEEDSVNCDVSKRPPDRESCSLPPCEYIWITGEWSECSVTCGKGYKQRLVSCSEIYTEKDHYEYGYQNIDNCPGTQPPNVRTCYLGECPVLATWRVGNWGSCSVTCGIGVMHRSVQCLTNDDQASALCHADLKPEERRTCHNIYDCELPSSCQDVKRLKGVIEDGEYYLKVKGRILKIYCAGMQTGSPEEYVTLVSGYAENFSEVYGYRLHNPTECPYNGSRREDCQCRKDYTAAGFSAFSKVRLDLNTMQIITTDLQFARTHDGRPVPYATAGDCYSAAKCPQGRFSIDLYGTGLSLTETAKWISQGNYAVSEIQKSPVRE